MIDDKKFKNEPCQSFLTFKIIFINKKTVLEVVSKGPQRHLVFKLFACSDTFGCLIPLILFLFFYLSEYSLLFALGS